MGNNSYQPIQGQLYCPNYGRYQIYNRNHSKQVILSQQYYSQIIIKKYAYFTSNQNQSFFQLIAKYKQIHTPTILEILQMTNWIQLSSNNTLIYKYNLYFPYYSLTLDKYLQSAQFCSESQIINMIDCVLASLITFKHLQLPISHITPDKIWIKKSQYGQIEQKNIYICGLPLLLNQQKQQKQQQNNIYYPKNNNLKDSNNLHAQNVYILGIITLQMALLPSQFKQLSQKCKQLPLKNLYQKIEIALFSIKQHYSITLYELLKRMLLPQQNRYNYYQIYQIISVLIGQQISDENQDNILEQLHLSKKGYNMVQNQQLLKEIHYSRQAKTYYANLIRKKKKVTTIK